MKPSQSQDKSIFDLVSTLLKLPVALNKWDIFNSEKYHRKYYIIN